jgi:hypothetical protein
MVPEPTISGQNGTLPAKPSPPDHSFPSPSPKPRGANRGLAGFRSPTPGNTQTTGCPSPPAQSHSVQTGGLLASGELFSGISRPPCVLLASARILPASGYLPGGFRQGTQTRFTVLFQLLASSYLAFLLLSDRTSTERCDPLTSHPLLMRSCCPWQIPTAGIFCSQGQTGGLHYTFQGLRRISILSRKRLTGARGKEDPCRPCKRDVGRPGG